MKTVAQWKIQPATQLQCRAYNLHQDLTTEPPRPGSFLVSELQLTVPLHHEAPNDGHIDLVGRIVYRPANRELDHDGWIAHVHADQVSTTSPVRLREQPFMVYLCGGPGADNPWHRVPDMNTWLLDKGFQIFYLDYRGCGNSSPITYKHLRQRGLVTDRQMAEHIQAFGQDNIVRDLEAVRLCLQDVLIQGGNDPESEFKWSLVGQSYGGYIGLTYLSIHPEGLRDVFIAGGLPPCGMPLADYFTVQRSRLVRETKEFYTQFPQAERDVRHILRLITEISPTKIRMTGRGYLTAAKLLTLGRQFGSSKGFREVAELLETIRSELQTSKQLTLETIEVFERTLHMDERPLYALLLEQTWSSGGATQWCAERVWRSLPEFAYLITDQAGNYLDPSTFPSDQTICFTSHVYGRFLYNTYEELVDFEGVADLLAAHVWECPYDFEQLARNTVPVYAVSFTSDMHLDIEVAKETAAKVKNMHLMIDEVHWHQALRHTPGNILDALFRLKETAEHGPDFQ